MGVRPLWPHVNIVWCFLVVERGLNSYFMSLHLLCIPIILKQRNDMYQKIIINRHIAIWSFTFVLTWEQNVHLILLSIANNVTYFKYLFWGSFLPPELIWDLPYCRGTTCYLHFRRHVRLTDYNFHMHVVYCITIHYHICHIDKYRHVEGPQFHNFGRLGISCFEQEGFCKAHHKSWESFLHIPSPTWGDLMSPVC